MTHRLSPISDGEEAGATSILLISPCEGEMSGRTEGGVRDCHHLRIPLATFSIMYIHISAELRWEDDAG